mmetsp:Transcript_34624/g.51888  ORF Transcript_34624/g.51888 Transcript_34624/m.51888 type:complete len:222 (+) Transcript_34624:88-753(+)
MLSSLLSSSQQHIRHRSACCIIARRNITSAQKRALQRKQTNNKTSDATTTSNQAPSPNHAGVKNIPKAPHMQSQVFESTAAGKKNGVLDTIKANPLIFAIFVFPTVMMGVALIVRPDFRAQILGTGSDDDKKSKRRSNASINVPKDAPAVYEETSSVAIATDDKEDAKDKKEEGASLESSATNSEDLQQSDNVLEDIKDESEEGKVKDLIYALGIRPHPSL